LEKNLKKLKKNFKKIKKTLTHFQQSFEHNFGARKDAPKLHSRILKKNLIIFVHYSLNFHHFCFIFNFSGNHFDIFTPLLKLHHGQHSHKHRIGSACSSLFPVSCNQSIMSIISNDKWSMLVRWNAQKSDICPIEALHSTKSNAFLDSVASGD